MTRRPVLRPLIAAAATGAGFYAAARSAGPGGFWWLPAEAAAAAVIGVIVVLPAPRPARLPGRPPAAVRAALSRVSAAASELMGLAADGPPGRDGAVAGAAIGLTEAILALALLLERPGRAGDPP